MIKIEIGKYSGLAINEMEVGDWTKNHNFQENETKEEFFNKILKCFNEGDYPGFPRFMVYSTQKNKYGNEWETWDWTEGVVNIHSILSQFGEVKSFFEDSLIRLIYNNKVYVFYFKNEGYGDTSEHYNEMTIEEYNNLFSLKKM